MQPSPDGLAQAFILGREFIGGAPSALVLGDNIFYGHDLQRLLSRRDAIDAAAPRVFAYHVNDPERYGVVAFDGERRAVSIEEKPKAPQSNYAVTGLYFYDEQVCDIAGPIKPSARGELEITDVNARYLERGQLNVEIMGRGYAWLDTGTHDSLLEAGQFIATLEKRQGLKVACPEEIAYRAGWIDARAARSAWPQPMLKNGYGQYLLQVLRRAGVLTHEGHCHRAIPGVLILEPKVFGDARGFFLESFNQQRVRRGGRRTACTFVQDNHSRSARGVLRGLHYQMPPHAAGQAGARDARARCSTSPSTCAASARRFGQLGRRRAERGEPSPALDPGRASRTAFWC